MFKENIEIQILKKKFPNLKLDEHIMKIEKTLRSVFSQNN